MTNILATIGNITSNNSSIKKIIKYTNFFRLNLSHNKITWHEKVSKKIKSQFKETIILVDLPGIKPRTKNEKIINIKKNQLVKFHYKKKFKLSKYLSIELSNKLPKSKKNYFTISDGKRFFKIVKRSSNEIIGKSNDKFLLEPGQGLNIPFSNYDNKLQEKKYLNSLKNLKKIKFDAIGLSFIQDEKIIYKIKKLFPSKNIISKIENFLGLKNLENIVKASDAIMIDRGDLQAELGQLNLFENVKKIVNCAQKLGKPIIMATENLGSMMENNIPSKNDLISIGYSQQINVDTIMLSEETAINKNYLKIIKTLKKILKPKKIKKKRSLVSDKIDNVLWQSLKDIKNCKVVLFTKKGYVIDKIRTINKKLELFIFTDNIKIYNQSKIRKNCNGCLIPKFNNKNLENFTYKFIKHYKKDIFINSKKAILLRVSYPSSGMRANTITILNYKSFL